MRSSKRPVLTGRVAVVTGAARGVGAAVARELSRRGATVALIGTEPGLLAREAGGLPGPAHWWEVDVTDDTAMAETAAAVRERLGTPSAVVANAGLAEGGPLAETSAATWRRVVEVNLVGSAITARTFLPDLTATRGYHLQVASLASLGAAPLMSAYCASKAGAESFAHSFQAETAHLGIAVGIGYLNWTDTDMIRDMDRHTVLRELRAHMPRPARKVFTTDDVAGRLVTAVERRSRTVYVPRWLVAAQVGRAALPPVVTRIARRSLPRIAGTTPFRATGLLGAGGDADPTGLGSAGSGAAGRP
ncbi:SDR family oxidoreductase [Streptomyces fuscigenes]|uniref:SDR family oxidoreductase n=1 Tax=Streptomyces fuscigenes TaxID=1528880 RepID=UPI001F26EB40|nr:SDR family oxidoreductase [Streptomyces fuscigenes]MCF3965018.1 SDR family oxidoreductase [Streptomyces fuscigenes]